MKNSEIGIILALIDQAFDHRAWHGTNLKGSIRGMSATEAAWRPAPGRRSIWEIVVHAAYWKYIARRRLLGEAKGSFPLKGSNWFARPSDPASPEVEWKMDLALLNETHKSLREAVASLTPADLGVTPSGSKVSNLALLTGIASHDLYHAGQIQLLKRLQSS
ncbi:MAG TPA: DinB family protein [Blastocatellia bacterium]|nr:DinB family protein [Blastocatellia bacterium]